jgi:hypothetical protein
MNDLPEDETMSLEELGLRKPLVGGRSDMSERMLRLDVGDSGAKANDDI